MKNRQRETHNIEPHIKGGIHSIETFIVTEAKIAALMRRIEALDLKGPSHVNQVNQIFASSCLNCQTLNHHWEECPFLENLLVQNQDQINILQHSRNNPYASIYNS